MRIFPLLFFFLLLTGGVSYGEGRLKVTNEMIYQKLLEMEKRQTVLEIQFREFKELVNRRFEDVNRRFEDINRRFEDINQRFEDINRRFEELRSDMNARFEQVNHQFDQVNHQFEQLYTFLWIITGIFTTLTLGVIGFAWWDRRTIIRRARDESLEKIEKVYGVSRLQNLIKALRKLAKEDKRLAEVLRDFGLL